MMFIVFSLTADKQCPMLHKQSALCTCVLINNVRTNTKNFRGAHSMPLKATTLLYFYFICLTATYIKIPKCCQCDKIYISLSVELQYLRSNNRARHMNHWMEIDQKHVYRACKDTLCTEHFFMNTVILRVFDVISDEIFVVRIYSIGTYDHKLTKWRICKVINLKFLQASLCTVKQLNSL